MADLKVKKIESKKNNIVNNDGMGENPYLLMDIYSKFLEKRIIFINTGLDSDSANRIKAQLLYLDSLNHDDIYMYIDCPGGEITTSNGILDIMDLVKSDICTVNIGVCASFAALLLLNGTKGKRYSLKRSYVMMHQPLGGIYHAQADDIEIEAKLIIKMKNDIVDMISTITGKPRKKVNNDISRDYWLTADEAIKYNIIDKIIESSDL